MHSCRLSRRATIPRPHAVLARTPLQPAGCEAAEAASSALHRSEDSAHSESSQVCPVAISVFWKVQCLEEMVSFSKFDQICSFNQQQGATPAPDLHWPNVTLSPINKQATCPQVISSGATSGTHMLFPVPPTPTLNTGHTMRMGTSRSDGEDGSHQEMS